MSLFANRCIVTFALYIVQCSYLVCLFFGSNYFRRQHHWPLSDLGPLIPCDPCQCMVFHKCVLFLILCFVILPVTSSRNPRLPKLNPDMAAVTFMLNKECSAIFLISPFSRIDLRISFIKLTKLKLCLLQSNHLLLSNHSDVCKYMQWIMPCVRLMYNIIITAKCGLTCSKQH